MGSSVSVQVENNSMLNHNINISGQERIKTTSQVHKTVCFI